MEVWLYVTFPKDSKPCADVVVKIAKGASKTDAAAAKAAEAGKFSPFLPVSCKFVRSR